VSAYLRKCRHCGVEAKSHDDLCMFKKGKRSKYGFDNCCVKCLADVAKNLKSFVNKKDSNILVSLASRNGYRKIKGIEPAWLYLVENKHFEGWIKIGKTLKKNINDRLSQYNTYSPDNSFKLIYCDKLCDGRIEGDIIDALRISNIEKHREWFKCDLETMLYHVQNYETIIEEYRKLISLKQCIPIAQYDLEGNFIATYESMTAASKATGFNLGSIGAAAGRAKRKLNQTGGFMWKVLPDYDQDKPEVKAQRQAWREEVRQLEAL
jgi:hypothetical protein